jgi:PAS domain S-box-containing protein
MVGRPLTDYVPSDLLPQFAEYLETILREGHAEGPMVIATPSGKVKIVEYRNTLRRQDPEEPIIRMVGQDVTEKIQAEKAQAFLASLVESSLDAIIGMTLEGMIVSWNRGAEELYGYSALEMTGKPVSVLFSPELPDEMAQHLEKIRRGERVSGYESVRVGKDGRRVDVALTISPVYDTAAKITGAVSIAHDISERKRAEEMRKAKDEAETASRVKSQFLASMSHEIRTPINGIIGMTTLLLDTELPAEQRRYAEVACTCGETLLGLINNILTSPRSRRESCRWRSSISIFAPCWSARWRCWPCPPARKVWS